MQDTILNLPSNKNLWSAQECIDGIKKDEKMMRMNRTTKNDWKLMDIDANDEK